MKNSIFLNSFLLLICTTFLSSCEIIGGIFKAGMGFGIFLVVAVIVGIGVLLYKMFS